MGDTVGERSEKKNVEDEQNVHVLCNAWCQKMYWNESKRTKRNALPLQAMSENFFQIFTHTHTLSLVFTPNFFIGKWLATIVSINIFYANIFFLCSRQILSLNAVAYLSALSSDDHGLNDLFNIQINQKNREEKRIDEQRERKKWKTVNYKCHLPAFVTTAAAVARPTFS